MPIQHLSADSPTDKMYQALERDGCVVIDGVLDRTTIDRVRGEMAPHVEATQYGADEFDGFRTKRTGMLVARSPTSRDGIMNPSVLDLAGRVLSQASVFQLHCTQIIEVGPGSAAQPIHRDQWAFDFFPFPKGYEVQCNTIWAMTDFTEENGATRIVPASHRLDHCPDPKGKYETMPAEMKRGSVLVWHGSLWHGGGANRSSARRTGIAMNYCAGFIRQQENQQLGIPREIAQSFGVELQRLVGYGVFRGLIGHIEKRDPIELLGGSDELRVIWDR